MTFVAFVNAKTANNLLETILADILFFAQANLLLHNSHEQNCSS